MYKVSADRPLSQVTLAILDNLQEIAKTFGGGYFIVGATARDILMTHVHGIDAGRATRDIDCAIAVESWALFESIKLALIRTGMFQPSLNQAHRLYFRPDEFNEAFPLDLIPFGAVEAPGNVIAWPPDLNVLMSVAGYAEALRTAIPVEVGEGIVVNVVSIPALAALKLLAWQERGLEDDKDAQDFYFLIANYHRAGNETRLFDDVPAVLESTGYDINLAGAVLLGNDTRLTLDASTHDAVCQVLKDPRKRDRLVIHMDRASAANSSVTPGYLEAFERGMNLASPV